MTQNSNRSLNNYKLATINISLKIKLDENKNLTYKILSLFTVFVR